MFNEKNAKYFDLFNQIYYVYFLLKDGNVVYVGQTDNILNRKNCIVIKKEYSNLINEIEDYFIKKGE